MFDTTPPEIYGCPSNMYATVELGTTSKPFTWTEPTGTDPSGTLTTLRSHQPGEELPVGITFVQYDFIDSQNNEAKCNFSITLETGISFNKNVNYECALLLFFYCYAIQHFRRVQMTTKISLIDTIVKHYIWVL